MTDMYVNTAPMPIADEVSYGGDGRANGKSSYLSGDADALPIIVGSAPDWRKGTKPSGAAGITLGGFGCLRNATDVAVCGAVCGPGVGDGQLSSVVIDRYRWVMGFFLEDRANLMASWESYRNRTGLVGREGKYFRRVHELPLAERRFVPKSPEPSATIDEVMANADRKARDASGDVIELIKRIVRERM